GNNVIDIDFEMNMSDSARDVDNYKLDGKALPAGSKVDFVKNTQNVRITIPKGTIESTETFKLSVSTDVTTAKGEHVVDSTQTKGEANTQIKLTDNVAPELSSAVYALAEDG